MGMQSIPEQELTQQLPGPANAHLCLQAHQQQNLPDGLMLNLLLPAVPAGPLVLLHCHLFMTAIFGLDRPFWCAMSHSSSTSLLQVYHVW